MKLLITVATHDSINLTELNNMDNEAVINVAAPKTSGVVR